MFTIMGYSQDEICKLIIEDKRIKEHKMTREEAIKKLGNKWPTRCDDIIAILETLGLIKFNEPKDDIQIVIERAVGGPVTARAVIRSLRENGYKIIVDND